MSDNRGDDTSLEQSRTITIRINAKDLLKPLEPQAPDFSRSLLSPNLHWRLSRQMGYGGLFWLDNEGDVMSVPHPEEWTTDDAHHGVFAVTDDGDIMAWVEYPREELHEGQRTRVIGGLEQPTEIQIVDLLGRIRGKTMLPPSLLLDIEGWGGTKGNFVICRRIGEGRPLCLFELSNSKKLFDVDVPYDYPVKDAYVDEGNGRVWLTRNSPNEASRGPFEIGLNFAGQVRELRGAGETYQRVTGVPVPQELPKHISDYGSEVVQRFFQGIRDSRSIGRDRFVSREGLRFEAKMLRQLLRDRRLGSLGIHLDRILFLTEGVEGPLLSASEAKYYVRRAEELERLGEESPKADEVARQLRELASTSRAYQRHLKQQQSMEDIPRVDALPSTRRVIDYMWETGEGVENVAATDLKKMLKKLGIRVPSRARADEVRALALDGPPGLHDVVALHLAIALDKPQDWYLRPLQLDISPLNLLRKAFRDHPTFSSESLSTGRAQIYHCQAYLVDAKGRKVFLGFGRNYQRDGELKELLIDGCVWLEGGYYVVRNVPRVTFWRRAVPSDAPEMNAEYEKLFLSFLDGVKSLAFVEDPDEKRPIRTPSIGLNLGISLRIELDEVDDEGGDA